MPETTRRVAITLVAATDEDPQRVMVGMLGAVRTARPDLDIDYTAYAGSLLDNIGPGIERRVRGQVAAEIRALADQFGSAKSLAMGSEAETLRWAADRIEEAR